MDYKHDTPALPQQQQLIDSNGAVLLRFLHQRRDFIIPVSEQLTAADVTFEQYLLLLKHYNLQSWLSADKQSIQKNDPVLLCCLLDSLNLHDPHDILPRFKQPNEVKGNMVGKWKGTTLLISQVCRIWYFFERCHSSCDRCCNVNQKTMRM
jgi:hypothetical protein